MQKDVYWRGGLNLYEYCANNPVIYYDPSGYMGLYLVAKYVSENNTMENIIDMQKFDEISNEFIESDNLSCMIRAMLSAERLWQPFLYVASHSHKEVIGKIRKYMDGVWERIFVNNTDNHKMEQFYELLDEVIEIHCIEEEDSSLPPYDQYLVAALHAGLEWFFDEDCMDKRADIVVCTTELIHDEIVDDNLFSSEYEKVAYFSANNCMRQELERIDFDYQISKMYPANKEDILRLKEMYQNMWIIPMNQKI